MKALLTFSILLDHADRATEIRENIKLYKEDDGLIWRIGGELGDHVEALPRPINVAQAKADARAVYGRGNPWYARAAWL